MKTPILGSAYVARSVNAADNRMVNLFPEIVPEGGAEPAFLSRAPGLRKLATIGTGPIRGLWAFSGTSATAFVVSGQTLYRLDQSWNATALGTVEGLSQVSMADNGTQLFVAANGPSYIYDTGTSTFSQITDPDFPGALTVGYLDGYFVFNQPNSQKLWVTALLNGADVDPLDFASAEGSPDGLVAIIVDHREVWALGTNSTEVWYNAGLADYPLQRIQGAYNEIGCIAPFSVAKMDNSVFWLGQDARGRGMVYRAEGYVGKRISTHAIEWQLQQYSDLSSAIAYTYQQDGHNFYVLNLPAANTTWVYDAAVNAWHERAALYQGEFVRHRANCQMNFNNQIVVGDFENGNIYAFDLTYYMDDTQPQRWLRSWRALATGTNTLRRSTQHALQLECETGVGVVTGQGDDPKAMLRWSDDGGHTWSNEHWRSMGKIGRYGYRTIWRRLGMTLKLRDRVYEVSGSDPVKIAITGAELMVSPTNA